MAALEQGKGQETEREKKQEQQRVEWMEAKESLTKQNELLGGKVELLENKVKRASKVRAVKETEEYTQMIYYLVNSLTHTNLSPATLPPRLLGDREGQHHNRAPPVRAQAGEVPPKAEDRGPPKLRDKQRRQDRRARLPNQKAQRNQGRTHYPPNLLHANPERPHAG
jgi:hypothetical protein